MDVATGGSLPSRCHIFARLTGDREWNMRLIKLRVRSTSTRFLKSILYTPVDKHLCILYLVYDACGALITCWTRKGPLNRRGKNTNEFYSVNVEVFPIRLLAE